MFLTEVCDFGDLFNFNKPIGVTICELIKINLWGYLIKIDYRSGCFEINTHVQLRLFIIILDFLYLVIELLGSTIFFKKVNSQF